jgi:hypothetical protein
MLKFCDDLIAESNNTDKKLAPNQARQSLNHTNQKIQEFIDLTNDNENKIQEFIDLTTGNDIENGVLVDN